MSDVGMKVSCSLVLDAPSDNEDRRQPMQYFAGVHSLSPSGTTNLGGMSRILLLIR
jgi:hypothetical protein